MALGQRSPPTQRLLRCAWAVEARAAEVKDREMHPLGAEGIVFGSVF